LPNIICRPRVRQRKQALLVLVDFKFFWSALLNYEQQTAQVGSPMDDTTYGLRQSPTLPRLMSAAGEAVADYPAVLRAAIGLGERIRATSSPARILLIDDDATMRRMLANYLEAHNMQVISAWQRQDVVRQFAASSPGLVILDLRLGQENGLDLLREIRSRSDVPVIITTGYRREEIDCVVGLELGADDYVTKPFGLRELLARIRAVLRRRESGCIASRREAESGRSQFGGWQLDRRVRRLTDPNGTLIALTKGEYALLIAFLDAPQRPLS
jgi:DNA-binding response OmpR family regulator